MENKTEQNCLISVIVPVYNAEKTLVSCIGSVLHQPFEDIEVLAGAMRQQHLWTDLEKS